MGESLMKESYEVTLDPKGEVVKYRDDVDVYYFSLRLRKRKWIVYLPATKGEPCRRYELTGVEQNIVLPRIRNYLGNIRYFMWFGRFPVVFEREGPVQTGPELRAGRYHFYWAWVLWRCRWLYARR
jgi:hypothetical protein